MPPRIVAPVRGPLDADVRVPSSKSLTHRALVVAALADGESSVLDPLDADDTRATAHGLTALGVGVRREGRAWTVRGAGGRVPGGGRLDLGESGSSMRFLAAVAALGGVPSVLDGHPRLRERPMDELYAALDELGAGVEIPTDGRALPARVGGSTPRGGRVRVRGGRSSQFVSALLMVASRLPGGLAVAIVPPLVSAAYVDLTVAVLEAFGVAVDRGRSTVRVSEGTYAGRDYEIEGDHSSASCLLAAAAIVGGRVRVAGLSGSSAQPDAAMLGLLGRLGLDVEYGRSHVEVRGRAAIPGFDVDLRGCPDLAPAATAVALFADGPCRLRHVSHLRFKESDRPAVLVENVNALGRTAKVDGEDLVVGPGGPSAARGTRIRTAGDHRMAMAFAVAGLRIPGVVIDDPGCVAKSFPTFWDVFDRLADTAGR